MLKTNLKGLIWPLSAFYGGIIDVWHGLYNRHWRHSVSFDRYVISVGNLAVGGTGKTPHVEYLIRLLSPHFSVATLSRGYGRKTTGYRRVSAADTALTVGDEPLQLYRKFGETVAVTVGEERALAIPYLLASRPETDVILLDDAFQHRAVRPDLSLLLTDYRRPFYEDLPFPAGRLRERRHGARRADAVLVTKCPVELPQAERQRVSEAIHSYTRPGVPVFFTTFRYGTPVPLATGASLPESNNVLLVTGLANPVPLEEYARSQYALVAHLEFRDHHAYTAADLARIREALRRSGKPDVWVLTSEKDAVKLAPLLAEHAELGPFPVFYVPIEVQGLGNDGPEFEAWVLGRAREAVALSAANRTFEA